MTPSLQLFSALSSFSGPALTWYASHSPSPTPLIRQELGGAVVSRWLAKMANLLGTDLEDLFGGSETPRSILLDLPRTWQEALWAIAASSMGWEIHFASGANIPGCDVLVTNGLSAHSASLIEAYLADSADVLLHDTAPLALSWQGELPAGAMDALEAIMSQPDALIVDPATEASEIPPYSPNASSSTPQGSIAGRVLFPLTYANLLDDIQDLWLLDGNAVVVPGNLDDSEYARIYANENCSATAGFTSTDWLISR